MKAIYINLDPYLAAFAAWLKGGKVGTKPDFQPLPLAVTIPLGEDVGIYCPGYSGDEPASFLVDGLEMTAQAQGDFDPSTGTNIASDLTPGFSAFPYGTNIAAQYYAVKEVTGSQISCAVKIGEYTEGDIAIIPFTVLVRREQASGPVDLVDFAPPLTASQVNAALGGSGAAEGQPLKGVSLSNATNAPAPSAADINAALVAAGDAALAGVYLNGAKYLLPDADEPSSVYNTTPDPATVSGGSDILAVTSPGS